MPDRYQHIPRLLDEVCGRETHVDDPVRLLEVGTYDGGNAANMIRHVVGHGRKALYTGFDLFEDLTPEKSKEEISRPRMPPALKAAGVRLAQAGGKVRLVRGDTTVTLPKTVPTLPCQDFIFIDGGHSLPTVANDWKWVSRLVGAHTVVLFDDYYPDRDDAGCRPLVDALSRDKYDVEYLDPVDYYPHTGITLRFVVVRLKP